MNQIKPLSQQVPLRGDCAADRQPTERFALATCSALALAAQKNFIFCTLFLCSKKRASRVNNMFRRNVIMYSPNQKFQLLSYIPRNTSFSPWLVHSLHYQNLQPSLVETAARYEDILSVTLKSVSEALQTAFQEPSPFDVTTNASLAALTNDPKARSSPSKSARHVRHISTNRHLFHPVPGASHLISSPDVSNTSMHFTCVVITKHPHVVSSNTKNPLSFSLHPGTFLSNHNAKHFS